MSWLRTGAVVKQSEMRFLPLVSRCLLTRLSCCQAQQELGKRKNVLKKGSRLVCPMLSKLAPPDPGGLSLATGFFFQVPDLLGFGRETKGLNVFEVCR